MILLQETMIVSQETKHESNKCLKLPFESRHGSLVQSTIRVHI